MDYKHTQIGYLMIVVFAIIIVYFGLVLALTEFNLQILLITILIALIILSFSTLNVMIDKKYLKIKFGYGIFKKSFLLKDITSVKIVKNHWYYGWGIRLWLWPRTWIFNVSGFDAVELEMKDGKLYRIGTDEPKKLEQAIKK